MLSTVKSGKAAPPPPQPSAKRSLPPPPARGDAPVESSEDVDDGYDIDEEDEDEIMCVMKQLRKLRACTRKTALLLQAYQARMLVTCDHPLAGACYHPARATLGRPALRRPNPVPTGPCRHLQQGQMRLRRPSNKRAQHHRLEHWCDSLCICQMHSLLLHTNNFDTNVKTPHVFSSNAVASSSSSKL